METEQIDTKKLVRMGLWQMVFVLIKRETFLVEKERILWILESMLTIEAIKCNMTERNECILFQDVRP